MISRAHMRRQLRANGGITNARQGYGIGSWVKERVRKLIPNELANVAVKAAPFVAMLPGYGPLAAGIMRGVGRFDQRGSISDALKQGVGTYAGGKVFGKGMEKFAGRPEGGSAIDSLKNAPKKFMEKGSEFLNKGIDTLNKSGTTGEILKGQLLVGGGTAIASFIASQFAEDPQQPGESYSEYMARRKPVVEKNLKIYLGQSNPGMSQEDLDKLVQQNLAEYIQESSRTNNNQGGRVGYQTGGITMANTLAQNIAQNKANQAARARELQMARARLPGYVAPQRTPVQEYAMSDNNILGPLSKQAASTIIEGQDKSKAALDVLNQTMTPTSAGEAGGIITQAPTNVNKPTMADVAGLTATQDSSSVPVGTRIISDGKNRYAVRPDGSLSFINTVTPNEKDYIDNFNKGPVEGYKFIGNQQYSDPSVGLNLSGDFLEFTGYGDERKGDGNFKYLQDINQTGMPRAITQDDMDTFNFNPPTNMTGPMFTGFDYSKEINWSPGQPAPEGYRVVNMMGDTFLERMYPSKEEVARLPGMVGPMALMGPGMMPPLNAPEDPDAGLSGQQIAEKYGIPYASGGRVGLAEGSDDMILPMKKPQVNNPDLTYSGTGDPTYTGNNLDDLPRGLQIDTTTSAYGKAVPEGTPIPEEEKSFKENLMFLNKIKGGVSPSTKIYMLKMYMDEALKKGQITKEQYTKMLMPFFGKGGENVTKDFERYEQQMNKGGLMRLNYMIGGEAKQMEAGAPPIMYSGNMDPNAPNQQAGLPAVPGPMQMAEDGPEFDMRENGGFQPLGRQEGKDDVPAMLAKNEFVMTADAVRAAGGGSVQKGAQRMYDTMKKLESRVS